MSAAFNTALMADCGGLIRDLGLALPAAFLVEDCICEGAPLLMPFSSLLSSLPDKLRVHIFVDRSAFDNATRWLDRLTLTCQISLVPVGSHAGAIRSPWIQDQISIRTRRTQDGNRTEIVAELNDVLAFAMGSHLAMNCVPGGLAVPGGNQLVGQGFRLVGYSQTGRPGYGQGSSHEVGDLLQKISEMDDRSIMVFGYRLADLGPKGGPRTGGDQRVSTQSRFQPEATGRSGFLRDRIHQCGFHVDQYVSVTGLFIDERPLLLVADPISVEPGGELACQLLKRQLDASVHLLEEQGFAVERNPIPLAVVPDTGKRLPRLYNNVLLENALRLGRSRPQVWVPQFGDGEALEEFDSRNLTAWRLLGFDPVAVPGWSCLASRNGAIRCVTKVVRRDEPELQS